MKLHTIDAATLVFHRVQCVVRRCRQMKTFRNLRHMIAMAHPNVHLGRKALEQSAGDVENLQACIAKFAIRRSVNYAAEFAREDLKPVADSQRRTVDRLEQLWIGFGRLSVVNRRRAAGEDQTFRRTRVDGFDGSVERKDLAIYAGLSNAAGY